MAVSLIPFPEVLRPALPTIEGNVDYRQMREQLLRIDQLLHLTGIEERFVLDALEAWAPRQRRLSVRSQLNFQRHSRRALRCNLLRTLLQEDFRGFAVRLADSPLFQFFCALAEVDRVVVPSKSTLQRYAQWIEPPAVFITRMNRLCIAMNHAPKKADGQRHRKKVLRKMDRLVGTVRAHARRYRQLLDTQWERTEWTRPQTEQVLRRLDGVLQRLPAARAQARQRILREQPVANEDKLLSFYEDDVRVIVRHKAGAEVEFGNTLFIAESRQGLIIDWELFRTTAPQDARLVTARIARIEQNLSIKLKARGADRGFDSADNQERLSEMKIFNGICPRNPRQLQQRLHSWKFVRLQRRRSQTEARLAIFLHNFLGDPLRSKGFAHRQLAVGWGVLIHNLWVLARLPQRQARKKLAAAA